MEKKALKNVPRLYLYHQMLMLNLKILNINQKGDFRPLRPSLIKKPQNILYYQENGCNKILLRW